MPALTAKSIFVFSRAIEARFDAVYPTKNIIMIIYSADLALSAGIENGS